MQACEFEQRPSKQDQPLARLAGVSRVGALVAMAPWQRHRVQSPPLLKDKTLKTTHKRSQGTHATQGTTHRWSCRMPPHHAWSKLSSKLHEQVRSSPPSPGGPQGPRGAAQTLWSTCLTQSSCRVNWIHRGMQTVGDSPMQTH